MKTKPEGVKLPKNAAESEPNLTSKENEVIPPGLEFFAALKDKTQLEMMAAVLPQLKSVLESGDSAQKEALAGLIAGFGIDLGVELPEWVKAASTKFMESLGLDFLSASNAPESEDFGKLVGLAERSLINTDSLEVQEKAILEFTKFAKSEAANESAEESKRFFDGRAKAPKILEKAEFMPQRAKVFFVIAVTWREIQKLESAGQLHRWLIDQKVIVSGTDSAETRKVCKIIGLKLCGNAGRPPRPRK